MHPLRKLANYLDPRPEVMEIQKHKIRFIRQLCSELTVFTMQYEDTRRRSYMLSRFNQLNILLFELMSDEPTTKITICIPTDKTDGRVGDKTVERAEGSDDDSGDGSTATMQEPDTVDDSGSA